MRVVDLFSVAAIVSASVSLGACHSTGTGSQSLQGTSGAKAPMAGAAASSGSGATGASAAMSGRGGAGTSAGLAMSGSGASGSGAQAGNVANSGGTGVIAGSGGSEGSAGASEPTCDKMLPTSMNCADKLAPGDQRTCMLGQRKYIVHAGKTMNLCKPVGLVIDAHGATETAEQQYGSDEFCASGGVCWHGIGSGWAAESDTPGGGFIAVFPQGNNNMWQASDAEFMVQIVNEMKKLADIDPKKVYISGISNGGFVSFQTVCAHPEIFRGMAPNAGGTTCDNLAKATPLISFDAMPDFAYDGHVTANKSIVTANHCKGDAKPWMTIDGKTDMAFCRTAKQDTNAKLVPCSAVTSQMVKPTTCKIWDDCDDGVKVAWCDVTPNMEHGADNAALDAHILYENDSLLNTPSVAWYFFKMFW